MNVLNGILHMQGRVGAERPYLIRSPGNSKKGRSKFDCTDFRSPGSEQLIEDYKKDRYSLASKSLISCLVFPSLF